MNELGAVAQPSGSQWAALERGAVRHKEIVDVRTDRGMTRAMLFPKAILKAEWDAAAPLRDALTIRREQWRPLRSEKGKNGQRPNE